MNNLCAQILAQEYSFIKKVWKPSQNLRNILYTDALQDGLTYTIEGCVDTL